MAKAPCKLNNRDREEWIDNDAGLYQWMQSETRRQKGGVSGFIKRNKAEIDAAICRALNPKALRGAALGGASKRWCAVKRSKSGASIVAYDNQGFSVNAINYPKGWRITKAEKSRAAKLLRCKF